MGRRAKEIPVILNFGDLTEQQIEMVCCRFSVALAESDIREIMLMPPGIREYVYEGLVAHCIQSNQELAATL